MENDSERKPESYMDDMGQLRFKWTDATAEDLHKIRDMMYNQARKFDETLDGRSWSKLFVGNGTFKMSKPVMTLFQDKFNVHYSYAAMRDFLKKEFDIDSPLPRHQKVDYPYEDHPDNVMAEIQNRVSREGLDPNTIGNEYDINDPKNEVAIENAIAEAMRDIETLDFEQLAAEQRMVTEAADMASLIQLVENDVEFERICKEKEIDPFQYAQLQFELRGSAPAISFADAVSHLQSFDKRILDRYVLRKENEEKGIYEKEPLSSILQEPVSDKPDSLGSIPDLGSLGPQGNNLADDVPPMDMEDHVRKMQEGSTDSAKKPDVLNEYMRQINQQDKSKSGAQPGYDPKAEDEKKKQQNHQQFRGPVGMGMNIRLPFEEKIASMITGAISYPGSLYRHHRDSAVSRKRVVESRNNLFRELHHVGSNFGTMDESQKVNAVKRITDTVNDYARDIQDAGDVAKSTGDKKLQGFLEVEKNNYGKTIKDTVAKYAENHPELEELKKYMDKIMDLIKNTINAVISALRGGKKETSSPALSM